MAEQDRKCDFCQKVITPKKANQRFCPGSSCRSGFWKAARIHGAEMLKAAAQKNISAPT